MLLTSMCPDCKVDASACGFTAAGVFTQGAGRQWWCVHPIHLIDHGFPRTFFLDALLEYDTRPFSSWLYCNQVIPKRVHWIQARTRYAFCCTPFSKTLDQIIALVPHIFCLYRITLFKPVYFAKVQSVAVMTSDDVGLSPVSFHEYPEYKTPSNNTKTN